MKTKYPLPPAVVREYDPATAVSAPSSENRAVGQACLMHDIPLQQSSQRNLHLHKELLSRGALPVGSVEFCTQALALIGIDPPAPLSYPDPLRRFLHRDVRISSIGEVRQQALMGQVFVKPLQPKLFTGVVIGNLDADRRLANLTHDCFPWDYPQDDIRTVMGLFSTTPVHASEVVAWQCEWRFMISGDTVAGSARYDPDGDEHAPIPDGQVISQMIQAMAEVPNTPNGYALDVGVLSTGQTALVEVNDAYAIGLYGRCMSPTDYLGWLNQRWQQITKAAA